MTGILGSIGAVPGSMVLGAITASLPNTIEFAVYTLDHKTVLVRFTDVMGPEAIEINSYTLLPVDDDSHVPLIASVAYGDSRSETILTFQESLTFSYIYTLSTSEIPNVAMTACASMAYNFKATVPDPPRAIGAYMSNIDTVDVVFDRPVAPYNAGLIGTIVGDGGSNDLLQVSWSSGVYPINNLRFTIDGTASTAPYSIELESVFDISINDSGPITIPVTTSFRAPEPVTGSTGFSNLQIIDASLSHISGNSSFVNVYLNAPAFSPDVTNTSNWSISKQGPHVLADSISSMPGGTPSDLSELIPFLVSMRDAYNSHVSLSGVHRLRNPTAAELIQSVNSLLSLLQSHFDRSDIHEIADSDSALLSKKAAKTVPDAISLVNFLKSSFNGHRTRSLVHSVDDTYFSVPLPNATDLRSASILVDSLRLQMKMHMDSVFGFHASPDTTNTPPEQFIYQACVSSDPIDLLGCSSIATEIQAKVLRHFDDGSVHSYPDRIHEFDSVVVSDVTETEFVDENITRITNVALTIRTGLEGHLLEVYPIDILNIRNYATTQSDVVDSFTYMVELELFSASMNSDINIEADLRADSDLLIQTNTSDYTGSISAPSLYSQPTILSTSVFPNGTIVIRYDRSVQTHNLQEYDVRSSEGRKPVLQSVSVSSSVQSMTALLDEILVAYSAHIQSAGHAIIDTTNVVSDSDYPVGGLASLIQSLNSFKSRLNFHVETPGYHSQSAPRPITASDAFDHESAFELLTDIRDSFESHNKDLSLHTSFDAVVLTSPYSDTVVLSVDGLADGEEYTARVPVTDRIIGIDSSVPSHTLVSEISFSGISPIPVLSSACVHPGLIEQDTHSLRADSIELFFSRPMRRTNVVPAQVMFSGATTSDRSSWIDDRRLMTHISNMNSSVQNLTTFDLFDVFGNPINSDPEGIL